MTTRPSREGAYADLVAGLLDVRPDPATDRFDAELAAAEDDGRIDPQTAKVLRWWQRESLRALVEHARAVVPPTMLALEASAAGAEREVEASSRSWARAVGDDSAAGVRYASTVDDTGTIDEMVAETTADERDPEPAEQSVLPPPTDLSEHRRRLLVAGLTRMPGQT